MIKTIGLTIVPVLGGIFYINHGLSIEFLFYFEFSCIFLGIVITDLKEKFIYDRMILAGLAIVLLVQLHLDKIEFAAWGMFSGLLISGFLYLLGRFLALVRNYEDVYGSGDVLISILIGALVGWPEIIFIIIAVTFLHLFLGIILYALNFINWNYEMPQAPLFAIALVISAFLPQGFTGLALDFYFTKLLGG